MPTHRIPAAIFVLACIVSMPATAQRQGAIEIGAFGRITKFADTLHLKPGIGGGGRAGIYIFRNVLAEMALSYAEVDVDPQYKTGNVGRDTLTTVSHPLWGYRLTYNAPLSEDVKLMLGAGYAYDSYGRVRAVAPRGGGPQALVGLRFVLNNRLSARLEGTGSYITPSDRASLPYARAAGVNLGAQAGLSLSFFSRARTVMHDTVMVQTPTRVVELRRDTIYLTRIDTVKVAAATGRPIVVGAVNFAYNQSDLTTEAKKILDVIATSFTDPANLARTLTVTGNTDVRGPEGYNAILGQARADQAMAYLVSRGVAAARITARSAGELDPIAPDADEPSYAVNRRVVIMLNN